MNAIANVGWRRRVGLVLVVVTTWLPHSARADQADEDFHRGVALAEDGKLLEAEQALESAWAARQAWDIAGNLGLVKAALGKWPEAAEHLDYALRHVGSISKQEHRRGLESRYAEALKRVVAVRVSTPAGSLVSVAGRSYSVPSDGGEHEFSAFVDAGAFTVEARRPGYLPKRWELEASVGQEVVHKVVLDREPEPQDGRPQPGDPGVTTAKPFWPIPVLGGVAALGLGLGITGFTLAGGAYGDAESAGAGLPDEACGPDGSRCGEVGDSLESANVMRGLGGAGVVVGGAALVGMIVYLVLPDKPSEPSAMRLTPLVGESMGLSLGGTF